MSKQRIVLVDDHEVVRLGLRALLEHHSQFEVIGDATTCLERLLGRVVGGDGWAQCSSLAPGLDILPAGPGEAVVADTRPFWSPTNGDRAGVSSQAGPTGHTAAGKSRTRDTGRSPLPTPRGMKSRMKIMRRVTMPYTNIGHGVLVDDAVLQDLCANNLRPVLDKKKSRSLPSS